jgi:5,5'-dehydrodivanillate O-demethylase
MAYGIPDERGLRCPYHGWLFSADGKYLEQPFDDRVNPGSNFKEKVGITAYQVEELGGLIFAYLGPQPAPLLPRWDVLVREELDRAVQIHELPCNWLQCMDNAADPTHFEYLHGELGNYTLQKKGKPPAMVPAPHIIIDFDVFEYGIMKRRLLEGEPEDVDDWTTGHPLLFPNILAVGAAATPTLQFRVPKDDTCTIQFAYRCSTRKKGAQPRAMVVDRAELFDADGRITPDRIPTQDMLGWVGQGPITDRTVEHLGQGDKGIILYRRVLEEQMERVAKGEDPMGTIRDPRQNEPWINLRRESTRLQSFELQYEDTFDTLQRMAETTEN